MSKPFYVHPTVFFERLRATSKYVRGEGRWQDADGNFYVQHDDIPEELGVLPFDHELAVELRTRWRKRVAEATGLEQATYAKIARTVGVYEEGENDKPPFLKW